MMAASHTGRLTEPPAPFRQTSPNTLELREGGGGMAVLGLPFFLAGVLIALSVLRLVRIKIDPEPQSIWPFLAFAAMGAAFIGVGAVMILGRRWLTLDVSRGALLRSYGLLVPLHTQERLLSEFNAVVVAYDAGDSDSPERYPVRLRCVTGPDFVMRSPATFGESRSLAQYLSAFLRLPLVDTTTDHETILAPGQLDHSLQQRLQAGDNEQSQPARPLKMRCQISESAGKTTIVIPGGGSWPAGAFSIAFPLFVLLIVMPALLRFLTRGGSPLLYFAVLLLLVLLVILPLIFFSVNLMVASKRKRVSVTASPAGIEISQRSGRRTRTTVVSIADLVDLDCSTAEAAVKSVRSSSIRLAEVPSPDLQRWAEFLKRWLPARGIIVKSRNELLTFGEGLPADELQYLTWLLRRALARASTERHHPES